MKRVKGICSVCQQEVRCQLILGNHGEESFPEAGEDPACGCLTEIHDAFGQHCNGSRMIPEVVLGQPVYDGPVGIFDGYRDYDVDEVSPNLY